MAGEGHKNFGADRVRFIRHGRGAAAGGKLHLALEGHQRHVGAELAEAAAHQRQPAGELGEVVALAVPRLGRAKTEGTGEASRDGIALRAKLVARADGAAELKHEETRPDFGEPVAMTLQRGAPRRDAIGNGDGSAACIRVRPISLVAPKRRSEAVKSDRDVPRRSSKLSSTGTRRRIRLVSITSWLVAPKWRCSACGGPIRSRN